MDYTDKKWYKTAMSVLAIVGTLLVTLNILQPEQLEIFQGLFPTIVALVSQIISALMGLGLIKKKETEVAELKGEVAALRK